MTKFDALCAAAYQKERAIGRRLTRDTNLSEEEALQQTLIKVAGNRPLCELLSERQQVKLNAAARRATRKQSQADAWAKKKANGQPDPSAWLAWFDGSTHPNPGKMGVGGLLKSPDGHTVEISFAAGHGDSSEAEFLALIAVLEEAVRFQPEKLVVYGDSQVVINAMNNVNNHGAAHLQGHNERANFFVTQLKAVTLTWIPRKKNGAADALSQQAQMKSVSEQLHED